LRFHNTGVAQTGPNVPATDIGRATWTTVDDTGAFLTGSLRQIAQTGPYMHDGSVYTLQDAIWFYRHGGDTGGYSGVKDPRIVPAEIDDADAHDLEAFLLTLTGAPIPDKLQTNPRVTMACSMGGTCP
jgi:cytochrome c peroxidase